MRNYLLLPLALLVTILSMIGQAAQAADCHLETHTTFVNGHAMTQSIKVCDGGVTIVSTVDEGPDPPRDSQLDSVCVATAISTGQDPFAFCDLPPADPQSLLTPEVVAAAFRATPIPPSDLQIQPANGRTLVNFDTNFYTETASFDRQLTLLGQRVDLHVVPVEFGWRFGDGDSVTTAEPGAPYPQLDVTHSYLKKGPVAPSVDTTYEAEYRVNGGGWLDVPGEVTIPGAPVQLEVLTATPTLVGYNS